MHTDIPYIILKGKVPWKWILIFTLKHTTLYTEYSHDKNLTTTEEIALLAQNIETYINRYQSSQLHINFSVSHLSNQGQ